MKIAFLSDLHLEFYSVNLNNLLTIQIAKFCKQHEADCFVIAGDIHPTPSQAIAWLINLHAILNKPIYIVLGNHDFYGGYLANEAEYIHYGDNRFAVLDASCPVIHNDVHFFGATYWTAFDVLGEANIHTSMQASSNYMYDYRAIKNIDGTLFAPNDSRILHHKEKAKILNSVNIWDDVKKVIVTHHVPIVEARHPSYPLDLRAGGFYSDGRDVLRAIEDKNVSAWIFGHHHCNIDLEINGTRFLSAQRGYPNEMGELKIGIVEI